MNVEQELIDGRNRIWERVKNKDMTEEKIEYWGHKRIRKKIQPKADIYDWGGERELRDYGTERPWVREVAPRLRSVDIT